MNYFMIRHLILKDLRHQRFRVGLFWLMAYLLPLTNLLTSEYYDDLVATSKTGIILLFFLLFLANCVSAILLDPTTGSNRFLATRPIAWQTLLISKVLFVLLFLWLPVLIFRLLNVWTAGVQLTLVDQAIFLFETTLFLAAAASLFILITLFFQRLTTVIFTTIGCALFGFIVSIFGPVLWRTFDLDIVSLSPPSRWSPPEEQTLWLSLRISSFLVVCTILALTMVPVGILRYRKPSLAVPITLVFAGFYLCLAFICYWPYPFDEFASDRVPYPDELASPLRDKIHFTLQDSRWDVSRKDDYEKEDREFHLKQKVRVEGIGRPFLIENTSSIVVVSLLSGKRLTSCGYATGLSLANPPYDWTDDYFRKVCSGISPAASDYNNSDFNLDFKFLGYSNTRLHYYISDLELPGATIRGCATYQAGQLKILKIVPFSVGSRLDLKRQCYEISQILPAERNICYLLNRSTVSLLLRGDLLPQFGSLDSAPFFIKNRDPFVIINRRTGEIFNDTSIKSYGNPLDGLSLEWRVLTRKTFSDSGDGLPPLFPSESIHDLDICFFTIEPMGRIRVPFSATVTNFKP